MYNLLTESMMDRSSSLLTSTNNISLTSNQINMNTLSKESINDEKYYVCFNEWCNALMKYERCFTECKDLNDARETERMFKTGFVEGYITNVRILTEKEISKEYPNYKDFR